MKKYIILLVAALSFASVCRAQYVGTETISDMQKATKALPRFKIYKTENNHIVLKLDTRTGKAWMTQFRSGDTESAEVPISYSGLEFEGNSWNGRFDMYPTNNMFKFIIVDTYTGKTYLLQWHFEENKRFIEEI